LVTPLKRGRFSVTHANVAPIHALMLTTTITLGRLTCGGYVAAVISQQNGVSEPAPCSKPEGKSDGDRYDGAHARAVDCGCPSLRRVGPDR
jgi:hypothetical protein